MDCQGRRKTPFQVSRCKIQAKTRNSYRADTLVMQAEKGRNRLFVFLSLPESYNVKPEMVFFSFLDNP
jgi:hypothetical protein